mgnify:CR=1 FL=1
MLNKVLRKLQTGPLIYPFLFAIYPILFLWSTNIQELSVFSSATDLVVPVAASIMFTCLLLGFFWAILRDWRSASLLAAFVLLMVFSYGIALETITEYVGPVLGRNRVLVIVWPVISIVGGLLILRFRSKLTNLTIPLNVMSLILVVFTLPSTLFYSPPSVVPLTEQETKTIPAKNATSLEVGTLPDIWYITAEGYSSARTLQRNLNYDMTSFLDYLESRDFYVAAESHSNYGGTLMSLASSLNMQTLQQFVIDNPDWEKDSGPRAIIRDNKAMRFARQHGYHIVYISDRFSAGSEELGDTYFGCGTRRFGIHREGFVDALLMTTVLNPFLIRFSILEPKLNDRRVCDFFQLAKAKDIPGPKVVAVHLKAPGYPFVVGPDGEVINAQKSPDRYQQAFLDQLSWTNNRLEWLIDILLSDPDYSPVIVIQGDHGETAAQTKRGVAIDDY